LPLKLRVPAFNLPRAKPFSLFYFSLRMPCKGGEAYQLESERENSEAIVDRDSDTGQQKRFQKNPVGRN
jgi:hypothetical protein